MRPKLQESVEERRAAVLLGLPAAELRRYSQISGLGHVEKGERGERVVYTHDELRRICLTATQSPKSN